MTGDLIGNRQDVQTSCGCRKETWEAQKPGTAIYTHSGKLPGILESPSEGNYGGEETGAGAGGADKGSSTLHPVWKGEHSESVECGILRLVWKVGGRGRGKMLE